MPATNDQINTFLLSELLRLRRDQSILERLYGRLNQAGPQLRVKFESLLADVQERANWLDRMLDEMPAAA